MIYVLGYIGTDRKFLLFNLFDSIYANTHNICVCSYIYVCIYILALLPENTGQMHLYMTTSMRNHLAYKTHRNIPNIVL